MKDPDLENELFSEAAESFVRRLREGEYPSQTEYTDKYPELAERIRKLFPPLAAIEKLGVAEGESSGSDASRSAKMAQAKIPHQLGDYSILREVGRGGMGIVYEALQESLGRHVALKVLPFHGLLHPAHLKRFRREARAAARLHHTNIVPVFGVGEHEGIHYYAMQFIQGQGVDEVLTQVRTLRGKRSHFPVSMRDGASQTAAAESYAPSVAASVAGNLLTGRFSGNITGHAASTEGPPEHSRDLAKGTGLLSGSSSKRAGPASTPLQSQLTSRPEALYFRSVAQVGMQVAEALQYAHCESVLHRDIKPSNLLLDTTGRVWITDFGLAKADDSDDLTSPGDVVGTMTYMAPERFQSKSDARSDVYGLGVTLYEMVTLRPAFEGWHRAQLVDRVSREEPRRPCKLDPHIPRDLETMILKAIAKEPANRYQTAAEFADDLRRFLADRPILSRRTSTVEKTWRWCRRNPVVACLLGLVFVLLVAVSVISSVSSVLLRGQLSRAERAETAESIAKQDAIEELFRSYFAQAQASRWSGRIGQRFESLQALKEAARIARSLRLDDRYILDLRNEAIACTTLADLRLAKECEHYAPPDVRGVAAPFCLDAHLGRYAAADAEGSVRIHDLNTKREILRLKGTAGVPKVLQFSPDGQFLSLTQESGQLFVWDLSREQLIYQAMQGAGGDGFAWGPDSRWMAVGRNDTSIGLYSLPSCQERKRLTAHGVPQVLAVHGDGSQLAVSCGNSPLVRILAVETGELIAEFNHPDYATVAGWSGDGQLLAVNCVNNVFVWDVSSRKQQAVLAGHQSLVTNVAFHPDGQLAASTGWDASLRLWHLRTGKQILHCPGVWLPPQFSVDGRLVAASLRNPETFQIWEFASGQECHILNCRKLPEKGPRGVDFSPKGGLLAVAHCDGVGLWDETRAREVAHLPGNYHCSVLFHPDGSSLITYGASGLRRWPIRDVSPAAGKKRARTAALEIGPPELLYMPALWFENLRAAWDHEGRLLAFTDRPNDQALILNPDDPGTVAQIGHHPRIADISASPDGKWVATGTFGGEGVRIWDHKQQEYVRELPCHHANVLFSPDGEWLATGSPTEYSLWRVGSWQIHRRIPRTGAVLPGHMSFTRDCKVMALADTDRLVKLLEPTSGRVFASLPAPEGVLISWLCFNGDGSALAVASENHIVQVWDLRKIQEQLRALALDWDLPPYPPEDDRQGTQAPEVQVRLGTRRNRWEAEDLAITERVACALEVQEMTPFGRARWSNGRQVITTASTLGTYFALEVDLAEPGHYALGIHFTKSWDYGAVQVSLDGKKLEPQFDGYDPEVTPSGRISFGTHFLNKGAHELRFTVVGKNPNSSGFRVGVDCIDLTPAE